MLTSLRNRSLWPEVSRVATPASRDAGKCSLYSGDQCVLPSISDFVFTEEEENGYMGTRAVSATGTYPVPFTKH